jgi:hypothetical protein
MPARGAVNPVLAWTAGHDHDGLAMALSMLGLRVRTFAGDQHSSEQDELPALFATFDALVDAPLAAGAVLAAVAQTNTRFLREADACGIDVALLPPSRMTVLENVAADSASWQPLCAALDIVPPIQAFPVEPPRKWRIFHDDRAVCDDGTGDGLAVRGRGHEGARA